MDEGRCGMTLILAYSSNPTAAAEECEALGITAYAPRRVDMIRQGKRRRPDPIISPAWPGYLFADITEEQWHWLADTKHCKTLMWIPDRVARMILDRIAVIEAEFHKRMAQIEAGERVWHFDPGDLLDVIEGPFVGHVAIFRKMAEAGATVRVKAEVELFGHMVPVDIEPLHVRKAVG